MTWTKKILIFGSYWMLADALQKWAPQDYQLILTDRDDIDITNLEQLRKKVKEIQPDIMLNCAAYTNVEDAEDVGNKLNYEVNTLWVYNIAKVAAELKKHFISISTDYVFSGKKEQWAEHEEYNEQDKQDPINQYGMSKYLCEKIGFAEHNSMIMIRTSWLYWGGEKFKNFVNTMFKLGQTKDKLKVLNDQFGKPTYTEDLAQAIYQIIQNIEKYAWKILHFSNTTPKGWITRYDFAKKIMELSWSKTQVTPCGSEQYPTNAARPQHSALKNTSDIQLPNREESLWKYLNTLTK